MRRITRAVACGSRGWEWVPQECFPGWCSTRDRSLAHEDTDTLLSLAGSGGLDTCYGTTLLLPPQRPPQGNRPSESREGKNRCGSPDHAVRVMLQADVTADAQEGLRAGICIATLRWCSRAPCTSLPPSLIPFCSAAPSVHLPSPLQELPGHSGKMSRFGPRCSAPPDVQWEWKTGRYPP